ncbi:MAG TPA: flagellar motor switch protein FliG [bacterium]|nr:flagellar motor switch protein FliG [bacterium]
MARLTGTQKAAILLLSLGEEAAAEVLKNLSEEEIVDVTRQMSRFHEITPQDVERVTNEYYLVAERARLLPTPPETKVEYLRKVLSKALGEERAQGLMEGLVSAPPGGALERLKWHDPSTIAAFIGQEHPQVIAVILANLGDPLLVRAVLEHLPDALQKEVLPRFARLRTIPPEWLAEIEESLTQAEAGEGGVSRESGAQRVADLLSAAPRSVEAQLMGHLQRQNPALAERVRSQMFPFEDFIKVDNYGMQKVLARTPGDDVVLALRLAEEPLRHHFLRNMSPRSAAAIQQALEELGPTPVVEIEAAQRRIVTTARELEEKGELYVLDRKRPRPPDPT